MRVCSKRVVHRDRLTEQQKAERKVEKKEQYRMLTDLYRMADLNSKGNPVGISWKETQWWATPLGGNTPFDDPEYEFETEARLSWHELRAML